MVLVVCLVSDAAVLAATEVQTSSSMLFPRDLHVLSLPKAVDSLVIYTPITFDEQLVDTLRSKAWTLSGKGTHLVK
jgi:hypothetical protein